MKKTTLLTTILALVLAACGGGDAGCPAIVDDGIQLFQEAIDELDGLTLSDLTTDPFANGDYERQAEDLERRTVEAGCTDEEMSQLFAERVDRLDAGASNPAGQFLISILAAAAEEGEFAFGS